MSFLQRVFNAISLRRDEMLWMSDDDARLDERLRMLAEFEETGEDFSGALGPGSGAVKMCSKNKKISSVLCEKANLLNAQGETREALQLYNQALQFCPTEETASIFAARSSIWADRQKWSQAISDVDLALGAGDLSHQTTAALLERKGLALGALGETEAAVAAIDEAIAVVKESGIKGGRLKSKIDQLAKLKKSLPCETKNGVGKEKWLPLALPDKSEIGSNARLPNLSDAVAVEYEDGRGRFCVAAKDIDAGQLIGIDEAYSWMLDKAEIRNLCWHCLGPLLAPVPCPNCSGVLFCRRRCLEEASDSHRFECGITEVIFQANIGAWALALRAMIRLPANFFSEERKTFARHDELNGVGAKETAYDSSDVKTFHNLVSHDGDACRKQAPELMMQALVALFLLRCLQYTGYLPVSSAPRKLSIDELFFCKLLHHFMRVAYFNTHETVIAEADGESVRRVGRATNPSLALFNHSCDPNYRRISFGRFTVAVAVRDIAKGHEIVDTYTATFATAEKCQRQSDLAKYNFVCNCDACAEDWGVFSQLAKGGVPKDKASQVKKLEAVALKLRKAKGDPQQWLEVQRQLSPLYGSSRPPTQAILRAEDFLYKALLRKYGMRCDTIG